MFRTMRRFKQQLSQEKTEELTTYFRSVIAFGRAKILEKAEEIFQVMQVFGLKYNPDPEAVEKEIKKAWTALSCVKIEIEHMTGKEAIELVRAKKND